MSKKAQFFLISAVLVVSFLSTIQSQLGSYSESNIAAPAQLTEAQMFHSIKGQILRVCQRPIPSPLDITTMPEMLEFIKLTTESVEKRGMFLNATIIPGPSSNCGDSEMELILKSDRAEIREFFALD